MHVRKAPEPQPLTESSLALVLSSWVDLSSRSCSEAAHQPETRRCKPYTFPSLRSASGGNSAFLDSSGSFSTGGGPKPRAYAPSALAGQLSLVSWRRVRPLPLAFLPGLACLAAALSAFVFQCVYCCRHLLSSRPLASMACATSRASHRLTHDGMSTWFSMSLKSPLRQLGHDSSSVTRSARQRPSEPAYAAGDVRSMPQYPRPPCLMDSCACAQSASSRLQSGSSDVPRIWLRDLRVSASIFLAASLSRCGGVLLFRKAQREMWVWRSMRFAPWVSGYSAMASARCFHFSTWSLQYETQKSSVPTGAPTTRTPSAHLSTSAGMESGGMAQSRYSMPRVE